MTGQDPFEFDDAAYVLGALSTSERAAFEAHLPTCAACRARVAEVRAVPNLLADVTADEVRAPDAPMPDTLLPGLLRRAATHRRRTRRLTAALGALAAACVIALVVALWPAASTSSGTPSGGSVRTFVALVDEPVAATASLTATGWGTEIDLKCVYAARAAAGSEAPVDYLMVVYDRSGVQRRVGDWIQRPDHDVKYATGTSLAPDQIARIDITLADGTPILRLTN